MAEFETLKYGIHDGVATIELARPQKRNAITAQMFSELGDARRRASRLRQRHPRPPGQGAGSLVLRGHGLRPARPARRHPRGEVPGVRPHGSAPVPVAGSDGQAHGGRVHGHALGAGFQLALACDLRIAAEDVRMGMLEVRFGLVPDLGGTQRLARLVRNARAKDLVWTGRSVEADEAERIGLVNRVVPVEALDKEAEAYARELAASPPIPVSLSKALLNRAEETPLETSMEREAQAQATCVESEDHREAVEAYLEQRPPRFQGR